MGNSVKMMLLVGDGEPTEIGRCHPGKARLMCKQGVAEWRDGAVWLKTGATPGEGGSAVAVLLKSMADVPEEIPSSLNAAILCPKCGQNGLFRQVDPRQAGSKGGHVGVWVNYRHSCGFVMDRVELPGADPKDLSEMLVQAIAEGEDAFSQEPLVRLDPRLAGGRRGMWVEMEDESAMENDLSEVLAQAVAARDTELTGSDSLTQYLKTTREASQHLHRYYGEVRQAKPRPYHNMIPLGSVVELLTRFQESKENGHEVFAYTDPRSGYVGFVDRETQPNYRRGDQYPGVFYGVPEWRLGRLEELTEEHARTFGFDGLENLCAAIATPDGRLAFFGAGAEKYEVSTINGSELERNVAAVLDAAITITEEEGWWSTSSLPNIDENLTDLLWGTSPVLPDEMGPAVGERARARVNGASNAAEYKARAAENDRRFGTHPNRSFPGWSAFRWPGCEVAIPVFKDGSPHPAPDWLMNEIPEAAYGFFRRVGERLYRVWVYQQRVWWDESVMDPKQYTYSLVFSDMREDRDESDSLRAAIREAEQRAAVKTT